MATVRVPFSVSYTATRTLCQRICLIISITAVAILLAKNVGVSNTLFCTIRCYYCIVLCCLLLIYRIYIMLLRDCKHTGTTPRTSLSHVKLEIAIEDRFCMLFD